MQKFTIGFDISTKTTGYAIVDSSTGILCELDYIDTSKNISLWETADTIRHKISKLAVNRQFDNIYIEESLQRFSRGKSQANTLSVLNKINALISYMARLAFNVEPKFISFREARNHCGIRIRKGTKIEKKNPRFVKQQIFDQSMVLFPELNNIVWPMTKITKKNIVAKPKMHCYDMVDAYVIVQAGIKNCAFNTI
jgi:hypothetical protein